MDFIRRQHEAGTPFFVWMNMTHMHVFTHTKSESVGQAGRWQSPYHDTMIDHDKNVGQLLDLLDELNIAEDTIVVYSTDNGPHQNTWPDAGTTPFRSEKNTNWEGAFRIPEVVRWPGHIPAGVVSNEIVQHHDWLPTFLAAAGEPEIVEKLKAGHNAGDKAFECTLTASTCCRISPARTTRVRERRSSTSPTTVTCSPSVSTTGRSSSWSSGARHAADLGRTICGIACSQTLQPPHRPVRTCRHNLKHLLGLAHANAYS